jgi:GntR family transcriptional regulator, transcriptional repressor for pyruvate dehydrogenase complex
MPTNSRDATSARPRVAVGQSTRPTKTAELVARRIVNSIVREGLAPGTKLPPEHEMLAEYGVARASLREALRYLELQGLLVIRPGAGGGPVVASPDVRGVANALSLTLQAQGTTFRSIVAARTLLEPLVAAEAAEHAADSGLLDEMAASVDRLADTIGDTRAYLEENGRFHELVAWASDNPVLTYLIGSLHWIADGSNLGVQYPEWAQTPTVKAHRRIYQAIQAGNGTRAANEMRRHNESFEAYLNEYYPHVLDTPVQWESPGQ